MRAETVILGAAGTPPVRLTRFVVSASAKVPLKVDAAALTPNPIDGVPVYPVGTVIKLATVGPENRAEALAESDAAPAVIVPVPAPVALLTVNDPLVIVTPPVNVLEPDRVREPPPTFMVPGDAVWLIAPDIVNVLSEALLKSRTPSPPITTGAEIVSPADPAFTLMMESAELVLLKVRAVDVPGPIVKVLLSPVPK